jgi:hypothetical protein
MDPRWDRHPPHDTDHRGLDRRASGRSVRRARYGGGAGAVGARIITFSKRPGQSAIDAIDAALPSKPIAPPEMTSALRKLDKID